MEKIPPYNPQTPEEWKNEVQFTKVRDRLVLIRNRDQVQFEKALDAVQESDAFIGAASIPLFVLQGSAEARQFLEMLDADYDQVVSEEDVDPQQFS